MAHTFLTIILQADPINWLQKLADQGLSLGILGIVSYMFWKQLKSVQDKMDRYQEEDRKEMRDVITRNTEVMERFEDYLKRNK